MRFGRVPVERTRYKQEVPLRFDATETALVLQSFREEAAQRLRTIEQILAALHTNPRRADLRRDLERMVHTMKAIAGMLGLSGVAEASHAFEGILFDPE